MWRSQMMELMYYGKAAKVEKEQMSKTVVGRGMGES